MQGDNQIVSFLVMVAIMFILTALEALQRRRTLGDATEDMEEAEGKGERMAAREGEREGERDWVKEPEWAEEAAWHGDVARAEEAPLESTDLAAEAEEIRAEGRRDLREAPGSYDESLPIPGPWRTDPPQRLPDLDVSREGRPAPTPHRGEMAAPTPHREGRPAPTPHRGEMAVPTPHRGEMAAPTPPQEERVARAHRSPEVRPVPPREDTAGLGPRLSRVQPAPARPRRRSPAASLLGALKQDRSAVRRAVLYREILGPPLGQRQDPGGWEEPRGGRGV